MQLFVYCILFTMSENVEKVFLPGHIVLTHLTELFLNAVLYHRHIYPDGIFRKRRAYNTVSHVVIFPPLISYLKRILEVLLELIQTETLNAVELVFISKGEQVECHELKVNNYTEITKESDFETQDTMKDLLLKLNCKLSTLNPLPEDTTFEINVYTTFGSLQTINSKSQVS